MQWRWVGAIFAIFAIVATTIALVYVFVLAPEASGTTKQETRSSDPGASAASTTPSASASLATVAPSASIATVAPSLAPCEYEPLADARKWACRPQGGQSGQAWYATAREARAACSASDSCKGYFHDARGYAVSSFLPSECSRQPTEHDTPVAFHAKAAHAREPFESEQAAGGKWTMNLKTKSVSACAAPSSRRNSTFRVCANSDAASKRCAYVRSGVLDPNMCTAAPEPTYAAFVPKLASGAFGPSRGRQRATASCAYRVVADEADARCMCAADEKCAGYYADAQRFALSVSEPGECEVDWALDQSALDAADKCTLLGEGWENTGAKETWCVHKCGTNVCTVTPPCPAGWTEESNRCLPPCPRARGRSNYCTLSNTAPQCPPGFEKLKTTSVNEDIADGLGSAFSYVTHGLFGSPQPLTQYVCAPSARELATVAKTATRA